MSKNKRLSELEKNKLRKLFIRYKNEKSIILNDLSKIINRDFTTVGKFFKKEFNEEYSKISKLKSSKHSEKITDEQVREAFNDYKNGISIKKISEKYNLVKGSLLPRLRKIIGKEYTKLAKKRKNHYGGNRPRKASELQIKKAFNKYKNNKFPLIVLANELNLSENALIQRFKNMYKDQYKKIAISRRDERKVTKEEYIKAFCEYQITPISLTILANSLGIRISSLRPRFINLFGKRYNEIAKQKLNGSFINKRGEIAEKLALEYLKIINIELKDVRKECVIKNTLKRPDFITGTAFIEVKSYFIKYSNNKLKGYKQIIESYLNKETSDGTILTDGIIISLGGFSKKVQEEALKDNIILIDYKDLLKKFDHNNKQHLVELLEHHFLPRWEL